MQLYNRDTDDYDKDIELTPWAVNWIIKGGKVRAGYDPFGQRQLKLANETIARADVLLDEIHNILNVDPFGPQDSQPDVEEEYDELVEWNQMTAELRRGLA